MDLKVTLGLKDHRDRLVKKDRKVTREREAPRVTWDFQVLKEKLVKREMWARKVNQARKA